VQYSATIPIGTNKSDESRFKIDIGRLLGHSF
jgi:hypothetical protein